MTSLISSFAIYSNYLSQSIPDQLSALSLLENIYLRENLFTGQPLFFSRFSNLVLLDIRSNYFGDGAFPDVFYLLNNLQILQFDCNLYSGTLPSSLSSLKSSLAVFSASKNNLRGDPFMFLGFKNISLVNISYNQFDNFGALKSIGNDETRLLSVCKSLYNVDISNNKFTGSLPDSIAYEFPFMKEFCVLKISNTSFRAKYE